ncbi:hypothetical protein N1851_015413 [Merluccius polli]|uniref:Reverse transcriptase n=1 Tax=Merluccius polli TaxID=89951 RepID=A0AA47MT60_MERPO|nr:hypothetical protein N1851_015413 [Merluccius polli]
MTTSAVCLCGKVCRNPRGLKIHQTKMKCLTGRQVVQRTGPVPGETQEEPGPESPHSAQTLHAPQATPQVRHSEHRRVKWPSANKGKEWCQFEEDVDQVLEATARGDADQKLRTMCTMIVSIAVERFGTKEQHTINGAGEPNRRQKKISQLRQELRLLGRQYKQAREEDKAGLAELRNILRRNLTTLWRAEWHRKRGKGRAKKRAAFIVNPFNFTKKILGQKRDGQLACSQEEVDEYLRATYTWIYQHGILPRLLWPLLVYDVPLTTVEGLERKVSGYLRRWLGLPQSLSSIALYGNKNKLRLPFSSLSEEFMVTRAREVLLYRDSSDTKVSSAGIEVRTGRKWRAQDAVDQAEARLRHSVLMGAVASGRAGLGSNTRPQYNKARGKERRQMIQEEVRAGVEETRSSRMVGMRLQGAWTRWEQALDRKISWPELWKAEPYRMKFLIQSVYDVLPSPSNLFCWGLAESPACPLCQRRGSLEHILSCCPKALGEGRYRWRHDQVLKVIAETISSGITLSKQQQPARHSIAFIKAGERPQHRPRQVGGLLTTARDWQLKVDLGRQLKVPHTIAVTTLRPDLVLLSESTRQVVLLELIVPWEDRMEEAFERKRAKYEELKTRCNPIEVGCRGFAGQSLCRALRLLGIRGLHNKKAIKNITDAAEKASRWLWIKRGDTWATQAT